MLDAAVITNAWVVARTTAGSILLAGGLEEGSKDDEREQMEEQCLVHVGCVRCYVSTREGIAGQAAGSVVAAASFDSLGVLIGVSCLS